MFYTVIVSNVVTFEMTRYRGNAPKQDNNRQTKQKQKETNQKHVTRTARSRLGDEEAAKKHRPHSLIVID